MSIKKIKVIMTVDTDVVKEVADTESLSEAITSELGWVHNSGIAVKEWDFIED